MLVSSVSSYPRLAQSLLIRPTFGPRCTIPLPGRSSYTHLDFCRFKCFELPLGVSTCLLTSEQLIRLPSRVNCLLRVGNCILPFLFLRGCFPQYDTIILNCIFEVNSYFKLILVYLSQLIMRDS